MDDDHDLVADIDSDTLIRIVVAAFLDVEKAFDNVWHTGLR